jgi:hypothetical protein
MQQFLRTTARALDTGETVHGVPAINYPSAFKEME